MTGAAPSPARLLAVLALALGAASAGLRAQPSGAPSTAQPLKVITDTREYCDRLVVLADALKRPLPNPPVEALALANEGERMCRHGHVRAGIARLRRAIVLLRAPGGRE